MLDQAIRDPISSTTEALVVCFHRGDVLHTTLHIVTQYNIHAAFTDNDIRQMQDKLTGSGGNVFKQGKNSPVDRFFFVWSGSRSLFGQRKSFRQRLSLKEMF